MATHTETALFFRLALRVGLATPADVERWIAVVLDTEKVIPHPVAELAGSSRLPRATVDELLGEFTGPVKEFLPGHLVMALVARRLRAGEITPRDATTIGRAVGGVGDLPEREYYDLDRFDDGLQLAAAGTYGDVDTVRGEVRVYFERYSAYAIELPPTL